MTGAAGGIGRAIAVELARQGAGGVAVADLDAEQAHETAGLVEANGCAAEVLQVDLRNRDQVEAMVHAVAGALGGLEVLVNNAGISEERTEDDAVDMLLEDVWDALYEVNLKAVWLATRFATPYLRASERDPNIVNTSSVGSLVAYPRAAAYCAMKGAVIQLRKVTALDLAPTIRCNCICPGTIDTPMVRRFVDAADDRRP